VDRPISLIARAAAAVQNRCLVAADRRGFRWRSLKYVEGEKMAGLAVDTNCRAFTGTAPGDCHTVRLGIERAALLGAASRKDAGINRQMENVRIECTTPIRMKQVAKIGIREFEQAIPGIVKVTCWSPV
jgi:hypothetical protein